ncbi:MAG: 4'-phosphopantetheinyl transferase superfamily protein [Muribaculaceae bacterium]|nr:4'-phosphopantetheinyl transferase superfamily protein [Muribaculaceae bacterium]
MCRHIIYNGTDIYIESLLFDIEQYLPLCNVDIVNKINHISSPRRIREIIMSHLLISKHIGEKAILCHSDIGAPYIKGNNCHISISHSSNQIALAINRNSPIGIDLENWREQLLKVKSRFLSNKEMKVYSTPQLMLKAWTMKESLYKVAESPGISLVDDIMLPLDSECDIANVNTLNGLKQFSINSIESTENHCLSIAQPL